MVDTRDNSQDNSCKPDKLVLLRSMPCLVLWRVSEMMCCRSSPSLVFSNHAWGTAIDFFFGSDNSTMDKIGDGLCQRGLTQIAPYLIEEGFFWGAGYPVENCGHLRFLNKLLPIAFLKGTGDHVNRRQSMELCLLEDASMMSKRTLKTNSLCRLAPTGSSCCIHDSVQLESLCCCR